MTTLASHVLVVFVDTHDAAPSELATALDEVTAQGCSGFLTLGDGNDASSHRSLCNLLAFEENRSFAFPKLPITVFSTCKQAMSVVQDGGINNVHFLDAASAASTETRVRSLLQDAKHLVFLHVTEFEATNAWLSSVLRDAMRAESFVSIVRPAQQPHADSVVHPLRPRQSFDRHNGAYAARSSPPARLFFSHFHSDRTRCDAATSFTERSVALHGAYGAMDARIFLKELAFRLGFAPKYGA
ncbi:hypothetical protein ATCC90586_002142 [Pythium insidiosum]|nr:hypothetical protein ATCC90586_002142 [Pythium insidiosum]